ncbi:uncharacterized protein LOC141629696 [Silene latifolia]|uniref:uncharacterized protein LOC141629696 n=1 Tax=Silene latifolia TaxID=37657 RepID=UPI003D772929
MVQGGGQKNNGKLFMMSKQEAEEDAHVVTGTFLVNNTSSLILFDSEETYSFVSRGRALSIVGQVDVPVNLLEFPIDGFEVIIGMDRSGKYGVKRDCHKKKVLLKGPKGVKVSYRGFIVKPKMKLISVITLNSCVRKMCPLVLCHVRDTRVEEPSSVEIPVVSEFGDVFPQEIPGLPPTTDIDLSVELKLGTGPISNAPYRMRPKEFVELKKQLNGLLDKGYI